MNDDVWRAPGREASGQDAARVGHPPVGAPTPAADPYAAGRAPAPSGPPPSPYPPSPSGAYPPTPPAGPYGHAPGTGYPQSPGPGTQTPHGPLAGSAPAFATSDRHHRQVLAGAGYTTPAYRNDGVAVTALVLGLLGIVVPGICLFAVAAGHLALRRLRTSYHGGRGLAVAGLVLGYVMVLAWGSVLLMVLSVRLGL